MLYFYEYNSPRADKIIIRELSGLVTEQQYFKDGMLVDKDTFTWRVNNKRLEAVFGNQGGVVIVPPTIGSEYCLRCIATDAFKEVTPTLVVVLTQDRVTLESGAFNYVNKAKVFSWLKRSEIPDNVEPLGRILEDVQS